MTGGERRAWLRLVVVVAAAAIGRTVAHFARLPSGLDLLLPLALAAAAYYLTGGLGAVRYRREPRYWRGRRIDDN